MSGRPLARESEMLAVTKDQRDFAAARKRLRRSRTISRPRHVAPGDTRSPMLRLLQDHMPFGNCEPGYEQQFRTMFKAKRLGLLDDEFRLTAKGEAFVKEGGQS